MPSQLGKYTLQRTLGSGANSKVKLGVDKETGKFYAIKILKKGNPNLDSKFLELVITEVNTMTQLSHPNIVNLIEYSQDGVVKKADGSQHAVIYIALELATGGELFDYVALTGRFSEPVARFYFRQLLDGLDYVHQRGVTHRDLKPENVLYDSQFNLKIADFGFAAPIAGRDGTGTCKTKLGTESYMAPEIHMRRPYVGASVDLFACAIILFIMVTQHPPFTKAEPNDPFYRLLCANRADLFWKAHSRNKPNGADFFSEEFKNLITGMLQFDPAMRPSMAEVRNHPWVVNGPVATLQDIAHEFSQRKQAIDAENEAKRIQKEQERQAKMIAAGGHGVGRRQYKNLTVFRSDEEESKDKYEVSVSTRVLDDYIRLVHKNTEFFSTINPDELLGELAYFLQERGQKVRIDDKKFKLHATLNIDFGQEGDDEEKNEDDEDMDEEEKKKEEEDQAIDMTVKILRVKENEKFCVEFTRTGGDQLLFFNAFNTIRDALADLANSSY